MIVFGWPRFGLGFRLHAAREQFWIANFGGWQGREEDDEVFTPERDLPHVKQ